MPKSKHPRTSKINSHVYGKHKYLTTDDSSLGYELLKYVQKIDSIFIHKKSLYSDVFCADVLENVRLKYI